MTRFAVIGGGAWGTALAALYAKAGHEVTLYARDTAMAAAINQSRENARYLPGIPVPQGLTATDDLAAATTGAEIVLAVVPTQSVRAVAASLAPLLQDRTPVVLCAKGIEKATGDFASDVLREEAPTARAAVLSGPSFAADVASGLPTAVTVAAGEIALADDLARALSTETLRCYASDDLAGVEAGGALKNILAIAVGAVHGRRLGASAAAALTARGFVELRRLGEALGGRAETLMGLSGLGDLILTCSSAQSRNFTFGLALGRGEDVSKLKLAEGVHSAEIAARIAAERGIEAPIIDVVAAVVAGRMTLEEAMKALLARPLKREWD
ncbi:NAD(P)H-dependent glycerol-3-phosphate dehydrogenase [Consotaella salsifontis]|uniref:Glycerol-3-phosphate dehydrogenase [NAD(P)+] n=1 Tax=Consotaella salsifontis TaxID=1365950 RepID=A0A1T4QRD3_9HYPH|nr:NAD(P)H-dependent glycerol-3-phosphate dehydrogenase [Consotaella salsifontis]SKA06349.1 glycerol-3-phosphate dehydrogenase (NAD(P)+) [Consotaella salsifontis]